MSFKSFTNPGISANSAKNVTSAALRFGSKFVSNPEVVQLPTRLAIITQFYPPDYAATGQLIEELAKQLGCQGVQIHVFTGQPGYAFQKSSAPSREQSDYIAVRRSRTGRLWPQRIRGKVINSLLFCVRAALHLLKIACRQDLLLVTTAPPYLPVIGYLANLCFGLPYVCLLYDLYPDIAVELNVIPNQHWLVRLWDAANRAIWRRAEGIIVLSDAMKDRVVAKCPQVADKVSVIASWADPNWIVPRDKQDNWFAQEHHLVDKFTVLYSGNMGRCHDMDTLLEVVKLLQHEPVQFVFVGGGAKYKICREQVQSLGLNNCLFLPYQNKQVLPYSLTACDLSLVSVSPGMEGLVAPSKLYGVLAAGRPVATICEPHSYLKTLVKDAHCGQAFANGDSVGLAAFIRQLSQDATLGAQMGHAGREYLKAHFTPEIIAQEYSKALRLDTRVRR